MKKISRLFLYGALILVLLTAACAAEEGTPSYPGPSTPVGGEMTSTPLGGLGTAETVTGTAETPATGLETATAGAIEVTATQATPDANVTRTPVIPVTGVDVVLVECQFCVDTRAHALLVLPDTATFQVISPDPATTTSTANTDTNCATVEVNNGRQVVLCSAPELTPVVINICTDASTCTDFPINLMDCPLPQTPDQTQSTPAAGTTEATNTPSVVISTATPAAGTTTTTPTTP